jgi:Uma2 family endonuclease
VADFRRLIAERRIDEDDRLELLEGELVGMAAKGIAHELLKNELAWRLIRSADQDFFIGVESTVQLASDVLIEPDIFICRRERIRRSAENFIYLRGAVITLIVEVAASSLGFDRGRKAQLYARHGIRELWVIDAKTLRTFVHTGPRAEGWDSIVELAPDANLNIAALPEFTVKLSDVA